MSDLQQPLTDAELEQMIISVVSTENETLSKRIYGNLRKEFTAMKDELLRELKSQAEMLEYYITNNNGRSEDTMARFPEVYQNPQWEVSRQYVINRDLGLCVMCRDKGKVTPGAQVDNIIELTEENKSDWNIAYNPENLRLLCDCCYQHVRSITVTK